MLAALGRVRRRLVALRPVRPWSRALAATGVLAGLFVVLWWFLSVKAMRHGFFDLSVYYGAIRYWRHGGVLYDYLRPHTKYGFTYPPFAALLMVPMALLRWNIAVLVSIVMTALATVAVLYLYVRPVVRRRGWNLLLVLVVLAELVAAFEPMTETVDFGQVNMLLVFLVVADVLLLVRPGRALAGAGVGLATAIKLTPGVFILYLLVTRRWRAAGVAIATATAATLLAAGVFPGTTRVFLTEALVDTNRVGDLSFISNQSWEGLLARLNPAGANPALWAVLVLATVALWVVRLRKVAACDDEQGGIALTGILGCLISPVTWVHHLVWLLPGLLLLAGRGLLATDRRVRTARLLAAAGLYVLLSSRLVWEFAFHFGGWGLLGSNAYVLASLALLLIVPIERVPATAAAARPGRMEPALALARSNGTSGAGVGGDSVGGGTEPLVEPPRPVVGDEHP